MSRSRRNPVFVTFVTIFFLGGEATAGWDPPSEFRTQLEAFAMLRRTGRNLDALTELEIVVDRMVRLPVRKQRELAPRMAALAEELGNPALAFRARALPWRAWWKRFGSTSSDRSPSRAALLQLERGSPRRAALLLEGVRDPIEMVRIHLMKGVLALMRRNGLEAKKYLAPPEPEPGRDQVVMLCAALDPVRTDHPTLVNEIEAAWIARHPLAGALLPLRKRRAYDMVHRGDLMGGIEQLLEVSSLSSPAERTVLLAQVEGFAQKILRYEHGLVPRLREGLERARERIELGDAFDRILLRCHLLEGDVAGATRAWARGVTGADTESLQPMETRIASLVAALAPGTLKNELVRTHALAVASFANRYSIEVSSAEGRVTLVGSKPTISEEVRRSSRLGAIAGKLADMMALYPPTTLRRAELRHIRIEPRIVLPNGYDRVAGTGIGGVITLRADEINPMVFHHELAHVMDDTSGHLVADPEWVGLNAEAFTYGPSIYDPGYVRLTEPEAVDSGFIVPYCRAAHTEDKASLMERMIVAPEEIAARLPFDPVLAKKVELLRKRLAQLDPSLDESFWRRVAGATAARAEPTPAD